MTRLPSAEAGTSHPVLGSDFAPTPPNFAAEPTS